MCLSLPEPLLFLAGLERPASGRIRLLQWRTLVRCAWEGRSSTLAVCAGGRNFGLFVVLQHLVARYLLHALFYRPLRCLPFLFPHYCLDPVESPSWSIIVILFFCRSSARPSLCRPRALVDLSDALLGQGADGVGATSAAAILTSVHA